MVETEAEILIDAPPERVWPLLWDVARYPEFLTDVIETAVEAASEREIVAWFDIRFFRTLRFRLRLVGEPYRSVSWTLVEGDGLTRVAGSWRVEAGAAGGVVLRYHLVVAIDVPVPDAIARRLIDFNLPTALRQIRARAETGLADDWSAV